MEAIPILDLIYSRLYTYLSVFVRIQTGVILLSILGCEDKFIDTTVTKSTSNDSFTLNLTVSNDVVRLNESLRIETKLKRKVHKDSVDVLMKMTIDAVGGVIDGHSFTSPSSITVSMNDEEGAVFNTLSYFIPSFTYNSTKKEYSNYKPMGSVSATFNDLILFIPVQLVEP